MMKRQIAILLIGLLVGLPILGAWPLRAEAAYIFSGGGDGDDPLDPIIILTAEDLDHIRDVGNLNKHYKLGADIDLTEIPNWVPIGTNSSPFGGNFDGDHHTISNMTIDSSLEFVGLFGYVQSATAGTSYTTIKNVRLENMKITSNNPNASVGGLAGRAEAWTSVDRVSVSGTITGVGTYVGGMTGQVNSGFGVSNNDAHVQLTGDFTDAGGLAGYSNASNLNENYATGNVKVTGSGNRAGGLIGRMAVLEEISNSYATGDIEASNPDGSVGGLIGYSSSGSTITNSYASGQLIKASGAGFIGGLVGDGSSNNITVTKSYWNATDNPGVTTLGRTAGSSEGIPKSNMKDMMTTGGWSSTIWGIEEGLSTPYLKTFAPALRVKPISATYDTEPAGNVLQVLGYLRDGSIGETLKLRIEITNDDTGATVTDYVYEMSATGHNETFDWDTTIDDQLYPEGSYTLTVTVEDTVAGQEQQQSLPFTVHDTTVPTAVVSSTVGGTVNAPFPVSITFSEAVQGFTENDIVVENGSVTYLASETSTTYSATVNPMTRGQAVKVTVAAGAVTDAGGNPNLVSNTLLVQYERSTGGGSVQPSNNANLKQFTVKAGEELLALTPAFDPGTTSYRVQTSADEVFIEAALFDAKATVMLGEGTLVGGKIVALAEGDNVFELIVKAENGTVKSYTLTIQRLLQPAPLPVEAPACTFGDIKGHWAEQQICETAGYGIVKGHSVTEFAPQGLVTRVEFAAMLLRTLGVTPGPATDKLIFIDQDQIPTWATTTVSHAVESGLLQGYPDGSLRPLHTVTRSEMAVMMVKVMKWDIEQGRKTSFADDAVIPNWARGYIYAAVERGLLKGREGNQFSPSQPATRAEAAVVMLKLWHTQQQ